MLTRRTATFLFLIIMVVVTGCSSRPDDSQIANPASEYCAEQGGTLAIRDDAGGGQVGFCQFDDGTECEEWSYFRGECQPGEFSSSTEIANPASQYCVDQGGDLQIREHEDGGQYGVCVFDDGSECDEWAFFRGECQPGDSE
jgi:putative hemolysin